RAVRGGNLVAPDSHFDPRPDRTDLHFGPVFGNVLLVRHTRLLSSNGWSVREGKEKTEVRSQLLVGQTVRLFLLGQGDQAQGSTAAGRQFAGRIQLAAPTSRVAV